MAVELSSAVWVDGHQVRIANGEVRIRARLQRALLFTIACPALPGYRPIIRGIPLDRMAGLTSFECSCCKAELVNAHDLSVVGAAVRAGVPINYLGDVLLELLGLS